MLRSDLPQRKETSKVVLFAKNKGSENDTREFRQLPLIVITFHSMNFYCLAYFNLYKKYRYRRVML